MALTVGDYDRNRSDDLAISVPYEDLNVAAGKINVGAVNVIYGVPSGLTAVGDQIWHQDSPGVKDVASPSDFFGYANQ